MCARNTFTYTLRMEIKLGYDESSDRDRRRNTVRPCGTRVRWEDFVSTHAR